MRTNIKQVVPAPRRTVSALETRPSTQNCFQRFSTCEQTDNICTGKRLPVQMLSVCSHVETFIFAAADEDAFAEGRVVVRDA